jgi:meso-butanediol dehydrogenase/(S,S)-butanediol dehydrogenase/diacetyl reductase
MCCLENATALVTGGGQGIGRGIALELAAARADVVIAHLPGPLDSQQAHLVAAEIQRLGRRALALPIDVTDDEFIGRCLSAVFGQFDHLDILVNNAGIMQHEAGLETSSEDFDRCYDVNLKGIWKVTQMLLPGFKARGGGRIVNICSTAGRRGQPETPAYCASKAAVISLTQSLAAALGPYGINVNAVCPGFVRTAMSEGFVGLLKKSGFTGQRDMEAFLDSLKESIPLRRHLTAQDIGHAVVFLASPQARNITGQALNVDCGYTMN